MATSRYSFMPPAHGRERRQSSSAGSFALDRRGSTMSAVGDAGDGRRPSGRTQDFPRLRQNSRATTASTNSLARTISMSTRNTSSEDDQSDFPLVPTRSHRRPPPLTYGVKHVQIFYSPKGIFDDTSLQVNIAVVGNPTAGKSTFVRKALDLADDDTDTTRTISIAGVVCSVQLFELALGDVYDQEQDAVTWPTTLGDKQIHGAVTLYDVGNKPSFKHVPEVLNAVNKMAIPSVLAACKCDLSVDQRQLEPRVLEQRASSAFDRITTLQTSETNQEPFRRAIAAILSRVVSSDISDGPVSPRGKLPPIPQAALAKHKPSLSDLKLNKDRDIDERSRHDSSQTTSSGTEMAKSITASNQAQLSQSFLSEDSVADDSDTVPSEFLGDDDDSSSESESESEQEEEEEEEEDDDHEKDSASSLVDIELPLPTPSTPTEELGFTFDMLVDRLLGLGTHKGDDTFATTFLALYRKFAAPGQLVDAIVKRFDALDYKENTSMIRAASALRFLAVMEQWIQLYPGDFAHPLTLRRITAFIIRIDKTPIFAAAAKEMKSGLESVVEDDDTEWACCDKDLRTESIRSAATTQLSPRQSVLMNDPEFAFSETMGSLAFSPLSPVKTSRDVDTMSIRTANVRGVDASQKEAAKLAPKAVFALTKNEWRSLMEFPEETIAKEMTRMDWTMFSSIRPRDLVRYVSLSAAQKKQCKSLGNVQRMVDHFNHVRSLIINYILFRDKPKHRAEMLEKFMNIARRLRDLNNYNSLGAVLAAVDSTAITRLEQTKALVSPETQKNWMKLQVLMSQTRSYTSYRLAWENSNAERIPYLPLPIRDLTGAETGNKTFVGPEADGRINWNKFEVMGEVLVGIQRAQGLPYRTAMLQAPQTDHVRSLILNTTITQNDEVLFERSQVAESGASSSSGGRMKKFFKS